MNNELPTTQDVLDAVHGLAEAMQIFASNVDDRFDRVDNGFSRVDGQISTMDDRFTKIDDRFSTMDDRFSTIDGQFEDLRFEIKEIRREMVSKDELKEELTALKQDITTDIDRSLVRQQLFEVELLSMRSRFDRLEEMVTT